MGLWIMESSVQGFMSIKFAGPRFVTYEFTNKIVCLWDSRDRENHYVKVHWPATKSMEPGSKNVINKPLVEIQDFSSSSPH
ncbi:hypothetical protein P5V15_012848 [Pogonomyrmex californicus]